MARPELAPDVIVVGAGIAGLSAAWELAQGGASVVVIDMGSVFGGHAVMATGDLCIVGTPDQAAKGLHDSPEIAYEDWHFEKVHREVIAQKFDCAKCHSDMTATFHPETHRTNRFVQIETCTSCHKGEDR